MNILYSESDLDEKHSVSVKEIKLKSRIIFIDVRQNKLLCSSQILICPFLRFDCYYAAVDKFHDKCFNVGKNDYGLRMLNTFVNLCERNFDISVITDAIQVYRHVLKLDV